MNEVDLKVVGIVALALLLGVVCVVMLVRRKLSNVSLRAGGVEAKVRTHKPQVTTVSNIEQISEEGDNDATVKNSLAEVKGVVQRAKGNNNLSIGND